MADWRRGQDNKHLRTTSKQPCDSCGELAQHYTDGTVEKHKSYLFKKVKGKFIKTSSWSYCENRRWR